MKKVREDDLRRQEEKERDAGARRQAREDDLRRQEEKERDAGARRQAREDEEKRERDRLQTLEAMERLRITRREGGTEEHNEIRQPEQQNESDMSESELMKSLRRDHFKLLDANNFDTDLFSNNPILEAGKKMFLKLEEINWKTCRNCKETYICIAIGPRSGKCERCARNPNLFSDENDLGPTPTPACLASLTPIEKSCISIICPVVAIYKKGHSTASKGHTISVIQDVNRLATELPRLPADLPFIIIKGPNERIEDQMFRVRRESLIQALIYLKANNEDYHHINISQQNALHYPEDDIFQELAQIDPETMRIPNEAATAENPESVAEGASMLSMPGEADRVMEHIRQYFDVEWPARENQPVSEFTMGFFSKAFPDLFPDGRGDITKPRLGKNPSLHEYFKHLMRLSRAFVNHHCFTFVATNMLRRHEALTRGNVFAKHCTDNLTIGQLKEAVANENYRVINKLLYFAAPIPGTRQYLRYKTDQAVSFVKYLRISSNERDMFNFFQTFSAADLHWDDFHRLLLPECNEYLNKRLVDSLLEVPEEERSGCIEKTQDIKLRMENIKRHADIVDWYFYERIKVLEKEVLPKLGVKHSICRYEVQARGTIHVHMLLHVQDGPSHTDLERAFQNPDGLPEERKEEVLQSQDKIAQFTAETLGISAIHPNPVPQEWPAPYGQNVQTPPSNCLRQRYLDMSTQEQYKIQYEKLINRCMLHKCRVGYCQSLTRRDNQGRMTCRFDFPKDLHGFKITFDGAGSHITSVEKKPTKSDCGAEFVNGSLKFLRNHPTIVHHMPELLLIWGANIEGRPVQSYKQVLRYLLKYMFKDEPNSAPFMAVSKAVIEASTDAEPVRRAFQKILMKTVGEHDLSKQECHHILNGIEFVETSMSFVNVSVSGTAKVRTPELEGDNQPAREDNWASLYWKRDTDPNFIAALEQFAQNRIQWNPQEVSLYNFVAKHNKKWLPQAEHKVPHITPNFNVIPKKSADKESRYGMFLRTALLTHCPGTQFQNVIDSSTSVLEQQMTDFIQTNCCPALVKEEYEESQIGMDDLEAEEVLAPPPAGEEELHVEPEPVQEMYEQNEWMEGLKTIHQVEENFYENDHDYDDLDVLLQSRSHDWQEDRRRLNLSEHDVDSMAKWVEGQKLTFSELPEADPNIAPRFEDLNEKQKIAFTIIQKHIAKAQEVGLDKLPQLLLNISGGAGTGKTYWLNAVRQEATVTIGSQFVTTAAPSGTAAFLIGGETLHSLLYLPLGTGKLEPLPESERLMELQRKFEHVGLLVIDEKSMMGQEMFWMIGERLKQARPHHQHQPFGNLSIVLLGDWRQLPPVGDSSLFDKDSKKPRGYNLYQLFNDVILFDTVQRQIGNDQELFRRELQSLGDGEFSKDSWMRWRSRALELLSENEQQQFFKTGILACALKKDMVSHNIKKVKDNHKPIAPIVAMSTPKDACHESSERASGLISKIIISRNTLFRLTSNLWTKAGLTNGAVGKIQAIIYREGQQPPALPVGIIATFDDYKGPPFLPDCQKSVPIVPVCRDWHANKIHCTRTMLPIILGYALSIHKLQGSTCERVILNPGKKEFANGLLLVGATRTKRFENLAFAPFPNYSRFLQINNSKSVQKRRQEEDRMQLQQLQTLQKYA